jgi:hypothetical protein
MEIAGMSIRAEVSEKKCLYPWRKTVERGEMIFLALREVSVFNISY